MHLTDVCEIQMGYTARGRLEPAETGGAPAIQLRDLAVDGGLDLPYLTRFHINDASERYLARGGDVLFRSRGMRNTATAIDELWNGAAIAVLPLVLLRPKRHIVAPKYLAWVLNQAPAQRHFDKAARGTSLRMIPRSSLNDLIIDLPDMGTQQTIIEIDALARREQDLSERVAEKRKTHMSLILLDRARNAGHTAAPERNGR